MEDMIKVFNASPYTSLASFAFGLISVLFAVWENIKKRRYKKECDENRITINELNNEITGLKKVIKNSGSVSISNVTQGNSSSVVGVGGQI